MGLQYLQHLCVREPWSFLKTMAGVRQVRIRWAGVLRKGQGAEVAEGYASVSFGVLYGYCCHGGGSSLSVSFLDPSI